VQADVEGQLAVLQSRATEIELSNKSSEDALKVASKEKEEVMVQHDVLQLEVRKLRSALSGKADDVFGLENRKSQLEMSMEERRREIEVHLCVTR
jgi:hypothetical protein